MTISRITSAGTADFSGKIKGPFRHNNGRPADVTGLEEMLK